MHPSNTSEPVSLVDRVVASFDSRRMAVVAVLISGAIAGFLEFLTHLAVASMGPGLRFHAGVDATVIAILTMTLVAVVIAAARARRHQVLKEMETVAELNHHVRNALQVIRQSHLLPEDRQAQAVMESVDRIDRTLRHLFPTNATKFDEKKAELLRSIAAGTPVEKH
jgi:predicted metalloprotease